MFCIKYAIFRFCIHFRATITAINKDAFNVQIRTPYVEAAPIGHNAVQGAQPEAKWRTENERWTSNGMIRRMHKRQIGFVYKKNKDHISNYVDEFIELASYGNGNLLNPTIFAARTGYLDNLYDDDDIDEEIEDLAAYYYTLGVKRGYRQARGQANQNYRLLQHDDPN